MVAGATPSRCCPPASRNVCDLGARKRWSSDLGCSSNNAMWERTTPTVPRVDRMADQGRPLNGAKAECSGLATRKLTRAICRETRKPNQPYIFRASGLAQSAEVQPRFTARLQESVRLKRTRTWKALSRIVHRGLVVAGWQRSCRSVRRRERDVPLELKIRVMQPRPIERAETT